MASGAVDRGAAELTGLGRALSRPIVFFGGKGGVGKTTLAAARALQSASEGYRTLLVSTDPAHSTGDALRCRLGPEPAEVFRDLWAMELDPATEADRYIADVSERIGQATPPRLAYEVERQIGIARASPGAVEAALFDRFTRIVDEAAFERIIFDTAPSGHTLRLLSLPEVMTSWMGTLVEQREKVIALGSMWRRVAGEAAGRERSVDDPVLWALRERRDRFDRVGAVLRDPGWTAFVFVVLAERLPILETARITRVMRDNGLPVGGVIVNQVLPDEPGDGFLRRRKQRETVHLADIERRFRDWPVVCVPLLDHDPVGESELVDLASHLCAREEGAA